MPRVTKDPDALLDYVFDWSDWLETDVITSSTWTVDAGLTRESDSATTTQTSVWLSGGTVGGVYEALNRIVTGGGRTADRVLLVRVLDEAAYFCEVYDLEDLLLTEISTAAQVRAAQRAIAEATEAVRNYCHQTLSLVADDEITFDVALARSKRLFLPELPVVSVVSVVEDDETLLVGEDYQLANYGVLHRINGYWAQGVQVVTVTYDHGYSTIPQDIVDVCTRAASRAYQAGLRAADTDAVPGVASKSLGDYSVAYAAETGGGMSEGVLGASASRMLLLSEKDVLNRYRYVPA